MSKRLSLAMICLVMTCQSFLRAGTPNNETEIAALVQAVAAAPNDVATAEKLAMAYFSRASNGDTDAVGPAKDAFEKLTELAPARAEYRCYLGSVIVMKGRDASFPITKAIHVNNGLEEMDKAVQMAPDNVTIRLTRASTCLALPDLFGRTATALADLEHLDQLQAKTPTSLNPPTHAHVLLLLGKAYERSDNQDKAKRCWQKAVAVGADSKAALAAAKLLASPEKK